MCSNLSRAVRRRIGKPRPGTIRLGTIQPLYVWQDLLRQETLFVDPTHPGFLENIDDFRDAYDWMREQMAQRIPGYQGHYPWWAYEHFLDLRSYRFQAYPPNVRQVRLELAVPREQVLLSAYDAWHWVLNRWYLPEVIGDDYDEQEADAWEEEATRHGVDVHWHAPFPEPWESRMRTSWERIFDVDRLREISTIQATFERLELADIVEVTEFTSQSKG